MNCKYSLGHCCKAIANAFRQGKCICLEGLTLLCFLNLRINHTKNLKIKQGFFFSSEKKAWNINGSVNCLPYRKYIPPSFLYLVVSSTKTFIIQTQCLSHTGWSVFRSPEHSQWQSQFTARGHGSVHGTGSWCCLASVLPCLTRCQALGQKGILIFAFIHSEPELCLLILLKHAEYVEQKGHDRRYLYLFILCRTAKVNLTSWETGGFQWRKKLWVESLDLVLGVWGGTVSLLVTWLECTEIAPKSINECKIAMEMQPSQKDVTTRVLFL